MTPTPLVSTAKAQSIRASVLASPLALWLVMAAIAVTNGAFRETVLVPRFGRYAGHVVSTAMLVAAIVLVSAAYFRRSSIEYTPAELLLVGVVWVVLTTGFEFLVGYAEGIPVDEILAQYDVTAGQVWIVVPLTLLVAPLLFGSDLLR